MRSKKQEKKFVYEEHNIKIEKIYTKETSGKGEIINESCEKNFFVKIPNINYLEARLLYPRLAEGGED
jgi:hypothetical protein